MVIPGNPDAFKSIPCFSGFGPEAVARLMKSVREQSYPKGSVLMLEGEPCPGLFVVKSGSVKLYRSSRQGQEHIVRVVRREGCFECVPFFDRGTNPVTAEALEATTVHFLPAADFEWILANCPETFSAFAPVLAARLRSLVNMVGDFSNRQVYRRLARLLCQLCEMTDGKLLVAPAASLHQQHLACMLGCSRQIVNSALGRLAREGIIVVEARRIVILDLEALRRAG